MSDYTKTTNFASKDSLPSGNSGKIVKGTEIDTEFNNIQTAVATKLNVNDSTLTGTTTFGSLSDGTITITAFVDEDNMASDSATLLPTQQSVKAYVDSQVTAQDLDFQADSGGALSIDLDSETLTFTGGTGVDTSGSGNAVTFAIDSTVATLTGTQTLTNKTLTSPVLNTGVSGSAVLDEDNMASDSATHLATQQSIKAYVDSNVTAQDLDVTDGSSTIDIDLDSESLGILGGTGIDSTASGTGVTLAIDSTVTTLAGTQTLTNKTLTSPTLNTPTIGTSFTIGSATITEAELEILDGATVTTDELNVLDGITSTTAELNILDGVTSTAAELNILDGVTATATELNYVDGVTSAIQTQIDAKAALAGANFTGDVDVAGTLTTDAFSIEDATSPTLTLNDTTSANQKTTLSHTAGASVLTTGNNGVFGSFKVAAFDGTSTINRLLIANNGDVSLYEDGGATAKVIWDSSEEALEFDDNVKAIFGAGSDLQIYHDGSHSYVSDQGTGNLRVLAENFQVRNPANNEAMIIAIPDSGVTLYHNNAAKLATTSTGIDVTGTVVSDGATIDGTLELNSNSFKHTALTPSYNFIESDVTGENTQFLQASGTLRIRTVDDSVANPVERFRIDHGTGDISFYNSSGTSQSLHWDSSAESLGIGVSNPSSTIDVVSSGTNSQLISEFSSASGLRARIATDASDDAYMYLYNGSGSNTVSFRTDGNDSFINGGGNFGIGTSSPLDALHIVSAVTSDYRGNLFLDDSTTGFAAGVGGQITFGAEYRSNGEHTEWAAIQGAKANSTDANYAGTLEFKTRAQGGALQTKMVLDDSGNVGIGTSSPNSYSGFTTLTLDGTSGSLLDLEVNGTVTGEIYADTSFGIGMQAIGSRDIQFKTNNTERMRIDASGNVGIGTSSPAFSEGSGLEIERDSASATLRLQRLNTGASGLEIQARSSEVRFQEVVGSAPMTFYTGGSERMRIDSSGNLLVGNTIANPASGFSNQRGFGYTNSTGKVEIATTANDAAIEIGKNNANDGSLAVFRKQGSVVGSIGIQTGALTVDGTTNYAGVYFGTVTWLPRRSSALIDNVIDLGSSSYRFDDIFATNGTIQTSDRNEKQDIEVLSDAEQRVAVAAKGLLRKFRWISSVEENGDDARIHFGIIAQDLQDAFTAEGLDAGRYAMFISSTWTDDDGNEQTRLGVRYSELLAFIISAI